MSFEFNAQEYRQAATHQTEWGRQILAGLHLKGDERVLDLGCGDGVITAQLAALVPHGSVLGLDASSNMIELARKIKTANLDFIVKDINALDFHEAFDLIFSNAALHWVLDHPVMLQKVFDSLKPGGCIRFSFAAAGNCQNFIRVVKTAMQLPPYRRYFYGFLWPWYMPEVDEYRRLVSTLPFSMVEVWGENADRRFNDSDSLIRWIDQPSLVPFKTVLQPPGRTFFRDLVVEQMLAATLQADGSYFETFRRIHVYARKP